MVTKYLYDDGTTSGIITSEQLSQIRSKEGPQKHVENYASGVIEGIRAFFRQDTQRLEIFALDKHIDRLYRSMTYAGHLEDKSIIRINPSDFEKKYGITLERIKDPKYFGKDKQWLKQGIIELVAESVYDGSIDPKQGCYIRPKVCRGMKRLDDGTFSQAAEVFSLNHDVVLEAFAHKWGRYVAKPEVRVFERGVRSDDRKHKCISNYMVGNVAKNAAKESGFGEALLVDHATERNVLEGGGENIVVVDSSGSLWTPRIDDQDILDGITLEIGLKIAKNLGITIRSDAKLPLDFVMGSRAAMFYGTATGNELLTCIFDPLSGKTSRLDLEDETLLELKKEYDNLVGGKPINKLNEPLRESLFTAVPLEQRVLEGVTSSK